MSTTVTRGTRPAQLDGTVWRPDAKASKVSFRVRTYWGLMPVNGRFTDFDGSLRLGDGARAELRLRAASLDTASKKRDEHLRSDEFFDVESHPEVTFTSTRLVDTADGFVAHGELTIAGRSTPLAVPVEFELRSPTAAHLHAEIVVDRKAVGLGWNTAGLIKSSAKLTVDADLTAA